jgi:hypothetical protein
VSLLQGKQRATKASIESQIVIGIAVFYFLLIPIVIGLYIAGSFIQGVVHSGIGGQPSPHFGFLSDLEEMIALSLFVCASTSWAFAKYGLTRIAWILLAIPPVVGIAGFITINV